MNEIIRKLIYWTEKTGMTPAISFAFIRGAVYCVIKLSKNDKSIDRRIYIPGGCITLENWDVTYSENEKEIKDFIEEAKEKLEVK